MQAYHTAVLLEETIALLDPKPGGAYVDGTLGGGGHAERILELCGPDGTLIGIDRDSEAVEYARERLKRFGERAVLVRANFRQLRSVLASEGIREIDGAVFDLGISSHQLESPRGFSFSRNDELDMRMGREEDTPTAADLVNQRTEADLAHIIWKFGDERYARRVARAIVTARQERPIRTTGELADIVESAIPGGRRPGDIHPATRTFQAIRIEVNRELEAVEEGIAAAVDAARSGGRVCVISFHSGEDRLVKDLFRRLSGKCECPPRLPECRCGAKRVVQVLTRKPVVPGLEEIEANPRSRSARLRCARKL